MKEIRLYGELARRYGKRHFFAVKNPAEALRALKANLRGFEKYMCEAHLHGVGFRMFLENSEIRDYPEIHNPSGRASVIKLVPVITGSKSGPFQILLGLTLIAAALLGAVPTFGGSLATLPSAIGLLGVSMVLNGVNTLLTGPPPSREVQEDKRSHLFSGPINTTVQGKAVPVGYGRLIVGSAVISAGIETHEATS